jgi:DNA polymerase-3 subunit gamma/tau
VAYQVIARKFRPQSFADFVGQEHVTQTLMNALASDRFPHALLLTGPRGTGKTTTARIIAKTLMCSNRQDQSPCGQCQSCQDIAEGSHLDVIEIDGASNNGVDHIRELRETVGYMPSSGKYKVYIIDEVHMLSTSAFNALLKTLEEPPEHVVFIFATTEVQKIPATILSRCQRFDFRNHSLTDIKQHLQNICQKEGIEFEDSALLMIAKQANGSIRDALTLLDQLISFSDGHLSLDAVMGVLGLTDRSLLLACLQAIAEEDVDLMFSSVNQFKNSGYDPLIFCEDFLEVIRNALMIQLGCHKNHDLEISEAEKEALQRITQNLTEEQIHLLFDVTLSGVQRLNYSSDAKLGLEMLLFKLINLPRLGKNLPLAQGRQTNRAKQPRSSAPTSATTQTATPARASTPANTEIATPKEKPTTPLARATDRKPVTESQQSSKSVAVPVPNSDQTVGKTWEEFVHAVKQANGFLGALLEHTSICKQDKATLSLGLPEKMGFLFDKLAEPKNIERTKNFLSSFWNDSRDVEVIILEADHIHTNLSPKAMAEQARKVAEKRQADSIEAHPLVKAAESVFQDNITKVGVHNTPKPKNP